MADILHILPHAGGGAERHIDLLERLPGHRHERVTLSAGRTPLSGLASIPVRWPGILRRARRADIVHVHGDLPAMLSMPMLWARPSVFTTHGLHFSRRHRVGPLMRGVLRAADVTVCTSAAERDELASLRAGRLEVVTNGIDLPVPGDPAQARASLELSEDAVVALYLGQLEERKDPRTVVDAAAGVDGLVLLVAGEGPLIDELRARAGDRLRVLGFRDDPDRLLAAADVFVMPSRHEGLSFAVLEAMGHGLACVVSDGPGNPEAVGDAGVVVPAGSVEAWHEALAGLAADGERRERLGAAARARVAERFSADAMVVAMGALYAELLSTGPGPGAGGAPA
jgi:glycosyltransferase involved in cell wall biosynthesis